MSKVNQTLPAVLRRRARTLEGDVLYGPEFCSALLRAADELQVRQALQIDADEEMAVHAVAEVRLLRACLVEVHGKLERKAKPFGWEREVLTRIQRVLAQAPGLGEGRRILAIQIGDEQTLDEIIEKATATITDHFKERANGESTEDDTEPSSAGRDTDQPTDAQEASGEAGAGPSGHDGTAGADHGFAPITETQTEEADAIGHGAGGSGTQPGDGHAPASSTEAAPVKCDHKFVNSKVCLKCGWEPSYAARSSEAFNAHLDRCTQCAEAPFELCPRGLLLLQSSVDGA